MIAATALLDGLILFRAQIFPANLVMLIFFSGWPINFKNIFGAE
jgi:hypothetical protein